MKKIARYTLIALAVVLVLIQFIPVPLPENSDDLGNDLLQSTAIPADVAQLLKQSCYDCHSMQTAYPWYSYVAPVKWLVTRDVKEGREELNLSVWQSLSKRKQLRSLNNIAEVVEQKEMPMPIYTIVHRDAALNDDEIKLLVDWANSAADELLGGGDETSEAQGTEETEESDDSAENDTIQ